MRRVDVDMNTYQDTAKILLKQVVGLEICLVLVITHTSTSRIVREFISLAVPVCFNCYNA